jgi:bifunctional non-homologous end joining protein LigD
VTWDELDGIAGANRFTIRDAGLLLERAAGKGLKGWGQAKQKLPEA